MIHIWTQGQPTQIKLIIHELKMLKSAVTELTLLMCTDLAMKFLC